MMNWTQLLSGLSEDTHIWVFLGMSVAFSVLARVTGKEGGFVQAFIVCTALTFLLAAIAGIVGAVLGY